MLYKEPFSNRPEACELNWRHFANFFLDILFLFVKVWKTEFFSNRSFGQNKTQNSWFSPGLKIKFKVGFDWYWSVSPCKGGGFAWNEKYKILFFSKHLETKFLMCCIIWFRVKTGNWGNQITNFRFCTRVAPRKLGKLLNKRKQYLLSQGEWKLTKKG